MPVRRANAARAAATSVAVDGRVLVLVGLLLTGLALIVSAGAEWLHAT